MGRRGIISNVFISYSRQSEGSAKTLATDIEALGKDTWIDQELSGGQVWWELMSNLVYDELISGGLPVDFTFINSVDELHAVDHIGELLESAQSSPAVLGFDSQFVQHGKRRGSAQTVAGFVHSQSHSGEA